MGHRPRARPRSQHGCNRGDGPRCCLLGVGPPVVAGGSWTTPCRTTYLRDRRPAQAWIRYRFACCTRRHARIQRRGDSGGPRAHGCRCDPWQHAPQLGLGGGSGRRYCVGLIPQRWARSAPRPTRTRGDCVGAADRSSGRRHTAGGSYPQSDRHRADADYWLEGGRVTHHGGYDRHDRGRAWRSNWWARSRGDHRLQHDGRCRGSAAHRPAAPAASRVEAGCPND